MLRKLPEQLQEWLDGELPGEDFRNYISRDSVLRKAVRDERHLRVLIGHAFTCEGPPENQSLSHISNNDMSSYLDEGLTQTRMHVTAKHLMSCKRCFTDFMRLYLLDFDEIEPEPLPDKLYHGLLSSMLPERITEPGWLGELVLHARGGLERLFEPARMVSKQADYGKLDLSVEDMNLDVDFSPVSASEMPDASAPSGSYIKPRLKRPKKPQPIQVEVAGLLLEVQQKRERSSRALSIDIFTIDKHQPVQDIQLSLELASGETTNVQSDKEGHAYFLVPRGRSILRIGYRGHFAVVAE